MTEAEVMQMIGAALQRVGAELAGASAQPAPAPQEPKFMKVPEYAKARGFAQSSIRKWIALGMPAIKTGHGYRVKVQAADQWIEAGGAAEAINRMARR